MPEPFSSRHLHVAAIQMVSGASVAANLESAGRLISEAVEAGAELIALPEYFCLMGMKDTDKVAARERPGHGTIQDFLADAAKRHRIWLVGGTLPIEVDRVSTHAVESAAGKAAGNAARDAVEKIRNTTFVYAPDGSVAARYDKIHLFGFTKGAEHYDEARTIAAGAEATSFNATLGDQPIRVGLSICYDLRFPELYRSFGSGHFADEGHPDLMIVPSAFTYTTGSAHWEILLRARAIENQCYVLAPAQGGRHENGRRTWGHSMLVDPWGTILDERAEGEGVVIGAIDPSRLAEVRENLPALKHRVM